jgi:hypothetical protein
LTETTKRKENKMNRKKVFVIITVLLVLVAFISTSSIIAEESQAVEKLARFMFVQSAGAGSFAPVAGEDNLYTLTLNDIAPQTIYFSDRPERIVGQAPMQKFLDGLSFSQDNPPNAAIEILEADEGMDVVIVELFDPVYDAVNGTLQYTASILETPNHSHAVFNEQHDGAIPEGFGAVSLFIDSCPDVEEMCRKSDGTRCGYVTCCTCWDWYTLSCEHKPDCCSKARCDGNCQKKYGSDCHLGWP